MGGKPSKSTPKDMRLKKNNPIAGKPVSKPSTKNDSVKAPQKNDTKGGMYS